METYLNYDGVLRNFYIEYIESIFTFKYTSCKTSLNAIPKHDFLIISHLLNSSQIIIGIRDFFMSEDSIMLLKKGDLVNTFLFNYKKPIYIYKDEDFFAKKHSLPVWIVFKSEFLRERNNERFLEFFPDNYFLIKNDLYELKRFNNGLGG